MAKKKSTGKKPGGTKGRRKAGSSGDVAAASETAAKAATPKARKPKAAAKAGAKKAPVKLNDKQREFLKRIKDAGEPGYAIGPKIEQRTITALQERKLVKRGAKNKETGVYHYVLTKAGEKNLGTGAPEASP